MTSTPILRILSDGLRADSVRGHYWTGRRIAGELGRLTASRNRTFRKVVTASHTRFLFHMPKPIAGETAERAAAAAAWLARAQDATADGGVSYGYFPCRNGRGWDESSYPETTGYIIPTLLEYARRTGDESFRDRALRMARWEIAVQMPSGAVQGGRLVPPDRQTAAAFNTGMVLDGWSAAWRASGAAEFREAGRRAATFLADDMSPEGYFRTNGAFVSADAIKTYTCLCAWAMYRFGEDSGEDRFKQAAVAAVEAALRQQQANGWFANNDLVRREAPLLHTIGYTLQGVLEVGLLVGRSDFIDAARRGTDPIIARMLPSGFVHGRYYSDWKPATLSSCLTGAAQFAIVCYRLADALDEPRYRAAADRMVDFLKALQVLDSPDPGLNGAIAGSFPIFAEYMGGGYPNWATKYFLDALMLQEDAAVGVPQERR